MINAKLKMIEEQIDEIENDIIKKQNELIKLKQDKKNLIEDEKLYSTDFSNLKNKNIQNITFIIKDTGGNVFHINCNDVFIDSNNNIYVTDKRYNDKTVFEWVEESKSYFLEGEMIEELGYYDLYELIKINYNKE